MNIRIQTWGTSNPSYCVVQPRSYSTMRIHTPKHVPSLTNPTEGTTAIEALEKGLRDLQELSDVVTEKFKAAKEEFAERMTS